MLEDDVIVVVSNFKSQARGKEGITPNIIAETLPVIFTHLTIFSALFTEGINRSNILDPYQAGFKKFYSTLSAILKLTDDIR